MTRKGPLLAATLVALTIGTPPASAQGGYSSDVVTKQEPIPVEQVPEEVMGVAKGALEADPEKAYRMTLTDGQEVYGLEAPSAAAEKSMVLVTPEGEIVETETGEVEKQ
jgi:hypothetical protein